MDYVYENLGHERFQEFCNVLLSREFEDFQCFPVGQRDGGRDGISYRFQGNQQKKIIIFQVKFVNNPEINNSKTWLSHILKKESEKINKLIKQGAEKFYLITNVRGTSYPEAGSIDTINKVLEEYINIPAICWWREDLSRRIEKYPILKWSFPQIINGQDLLNSILFKQIDENKQRRANIVNAYLSDQYEIDNEVKFKQVELQNKLFNLFTDVPIRLKKCSPLDREELFLNLQKNYIRHGLFSEYEREFSLRNERDNNGAAQFILSFQPNKKVNRFLLEGGPGQGKSTISQYICQVHRVQLLKKENDIKLLPDFVLNLGVKLPIKIDLRDVSEWLKESNPYEGKLNDQKFKQIWKTSLESFLVGHIIYHSQIDEFSVNDLITIFTHSAVLIVFDGFDEIADLTIREKVVTLINKGIVRLSENSKSLQVVVTSRPAVFSDMVGFSEELYPHFELTDITKNITKEYVEKWIKAGGLDEREASSIRKLVNTKLDMPHLRELAKSPMQLAIFLSLLKTRGESLPDKRTALYDSYVELFFNRESEKNILIRDNRELIINIHQYIAWSLHSEAKTDNNNGRIPFDKLIIKIKNYLEEEGHKTDIADQLFDVIKERVCALVSRVQGTFEFEVQPLREYFCARFLYNTSPYSPPGIEVTGTKPRRFEVISKDFYWNNVVRFFAGCFDRGELPMLIDKLEELQNDDSLKFTNYPRLLTSQILSDSVFTQYPKLLKNVLRIIVDGINIKGILNQNNDFNVKQELILIPKDCGREELEIECFKQLIQFPPHDYAKELISVIKNNSYNTVRIWIEYLYKIEDKVSNTTTWLNYAYFLGIIHKLESTILEELIENSNTHEYRRIQLIINGNRFNVIKNRFSLKEKTLNGILDEFIMSHKEDTQEESLLILNTLFHPYSYVTFLKNNEFDLSFLSYILDRDFFYRRVRKEIKKTISFKTKDSIDKDIQIFINKIEPVLSSNINEWRSSIISWDNYIESARNIFGDRWRFYIIASIAAGVKSSEERFSEYENITDNNISLCKRVRCARMKSGNISYWTHNLSKKEDVSFILFVFMSWATPKTIIALIDLLNKQILNLNEVEYLRLVNSLKILNIISSFNKNQENFFLNNLEIEGVSEKLLFVLSTRMNEETANSFIYKYIKNTNNDLSFINEIKLRYLVQEYLENSSADKLEEIKYIYRNNNISANLMIYISHQKLDKCKIDINTAKKIMKEPLNYPNIISSIAENVCRKNAFLANSSVGEIAKNETWFSYIG